MNRWAKPGGLNRVFKHLPKQRLVRIKLEAVAPDSTLVKVHPAGTGTRPPSGPSAPGKSRGGGPTKSHRVAADACTAMPVSLSPGQAHAAPEGCKLL